MAEYVGNDRRRITARPNRLEDAEIRRRQLQSTGSADSWTPQPISPSLSSPSMSSSGPIPTSYPSFVNQQRHSRGSWTDSGFQDLSSPPPWTGPPSFGQIPSQSSPSSQSESQSRFAYPDWASSLPGRPWPVLRRTSSDEDARRRQFAQGYHQDDDISSSVSSLSMKQYPQRRPSNRDEFDGDCQLLEQPEDGGYEPKEEEMPQLPINLFAQEQDDILSKVNDRLSQCAFDFVARYQFPIPIEPDKRQVRVPSDREWSEWVWLLKRLATKRRIPARVLYNNQIKQLITILENSSEMRHAAKHQSRPLKDDRNVLQLISSGLQVAKILKDAPAMQYLDRIYVQAERAIQARQASASSTF